MLRSPDHAGNLYRADDVAAALNIAADVTDGAAIDTTMLLRAFANEAADEFVLTYDGHFHCHGDGNVLYVRRKVKPGRHEGKNQMNLFIGQFGSMESARRATAVRWHHIGMNKGVRAGLVGFLAKRKKRKAPGVSPDGESGAEGDLPRQPLVDILPRDNILATTKEVLHYTLGGRAGKIDLLPSTNFVTVRKLKNNLLPPADNRNNENDCRPLILQTYGSDQFWVPTGVTSLAANHFARLRNQAQVAINWQALFDRGKCMFSPRFQQTLTSFALHNMRGSDEGAEMIIAGVIKGLADEVGFSLNKDDLARGCPSRKTLARSEKRLAADCYVSVVEQLKKDNAKWVALMVDHGKRSGIEHFVKILVWAGLDQHGNRVIKYFCLDVDKSSHSAKDCADAIKLSVKKLYMAGLPTSIEIISITGDTGGGGAVQHIHPPLIANKTMLKESKKFNCQCHGLSRSLQNACEATFGKQGIGQVNIFQGEYVYVKMMRVLHEDGGAEIVDEVHGLVVQKLATSVEWQTEAARHGIPFDELWNRLMAAPELHDDEIQDDVLDLATHHARNIKMPNFARWMTIFPARELFLDNWSIIYFIAVAIKQSMPSTSSLSQYACTLIGLMNIGSGPPGSTLKEGQCPPLYAEGLFVRAFGECYFTKHFEWLLRRDPEFGRDSHGQHIRLYGRVNEG